MREIVVAEIEKGQRLDKYLLKYLNQCPKSLIYKGMRTNKIKYNGKKPKGNEILEKGDSIKLFYTEEQMITMESKKKIQKVAVNFKKVYEDENLLIVDKPIGLLTQKDTATSHSLVEEVLFYLQSNGSYHSEINRGFIPAPCNRLDRNTAGMVLFGKNMASTQSLCEMLQTKQISKFYIAIVLGRITEEMVLKGYHKKSDTKNKVQITQNYVEDAKPIETRVVPLKTNGRYTLIEIQLVTGKTHQIRAHLSQTGHPIIGDPKYGDAIENAYFLKKYKLKYQILCAYKIKFEWCQPPFEYLQDRVFTVATPRIYGEICKGEKLI